MKKTKIIAILSALVILTAMTGIASADPAVVGNVHVAGDPTQPIEGAEVCATCDKDNIVVGPVYSNSAGNYGIDLSTTNCTEGDTVSVTGTYGGQSDTKSGIISTIDLLNLDLAIVCLDIPIPEFATIAIPAVAILGLFLFFNHRKRKEE